MQSDFRNKDYGFRGRHSLQFGNKVIFKKVITLGVPPSWCYQEKNRAISCFGGLCGRTTCTVLKPSVLLIYCRTLSHTSIKNSSVTIYGVYTVFFMQVTHIIYGCRKCQKISIFYCRRTYTFTTK